MPGTEQQPAWGEKKAAGSDCVSRSAIGFDQRTPLQRIVRPADNTLGGERKEAATIYKIHSANKPMCSLEM